MGKVNTNINKKKSNDTLDDIESGKLFSFPLLITHLMVSVSEAIYIMRNSSSANLVELIAFAGKVSPNCANSFLPKRLGDVFDWYWPPGKAKLTRDTFISAIVGYILYFLCISFHSSNNMIR